jgi:hypothetical protein
MSAYAPWIYDRQVMWWRFQRQELFKGGGGGILVPVRTMRRNRAKILGFKISKNVAAMSNDGTGRSRFSFWQVSNRHRFRRRRAHRAAPAVTVDRVALFFISPKENSDTKILRESGLDWRRHLQFLKFLGIDTNQHLTMKPWTMDKWYGVFLAFCGSTFTLKKKTSLTVILSMNTGVCLYC